MLFVDNHDNAIIGTGHRCGQPTLAVYNSAIIRNNLMLEGMDWTDAVEFFEFNISGAWAGEFTPLFLEPLEDEDDTILRLTRENTRLRRRLAELEHREHK